MMETNDYTVSKSTSAILDCYRNATELYSQIFNTLNEINADFAKIEEPMQKVCDVLKELIIDQIDESLIFNKKLEI